MERQPHTIISYGREHTDLKEFFAGVLQDLGVTCEGLDDSGDSSDAAVISGIEAADYFIGLLTPDQPNGEGQFTCSQAVLAQISLALKAEKPIQLFAFDNVDVSGLVFPLTTGITRIQLFKTKFGKSIIFDAYNARQIFKTLLAVKQQIMQAHLQKEKA